MSEPITEVCVVSWVSSRVCAMGTKGCNSRHGVPVERPFVHPHTDFFGPLLAYCHWCGAKWDRPADDPDGHTLEAFATEHLHP